MTLAKVVGCAVLALGLSGGQAAPTLEQEFARDDHTLHAAWQRGRRLEALAARAAHDPLARVSLLTERRRYADAVAVLREIVDTGPASQLPAALQLLETHLHDYTTIEDALELRGPILEVLNRAKTRLPQLPREVAADAALRIAHAEKAARSDPDLIGRLLRLAFEYEGTAAAWSAQIELLSSGSELAGVRTLEEFARAHPGTVHGAQALFRVAYTLAHGTGVGEGAREVDPTDRFFRVQEMVKELQGGSWPDSEWVRRAPELLLGFSSYEPQYAPGNVDRLIDGYRRVVADRIIAVDPDPVIDEILGTITYTIPRLYLAKGAPLQQMDALFDGWARIPGRAGYVRYLQAETFVSWATEFREERDHWLTRAQETFRVVADSNDPHYARPALAALASLHFSEHELAESISLDRRYLSQYPDSPFAWRAALRLAQAQEETGDWRAGAESYERAASDYRREPLAAVLGYANAARAREVLGEFESAREGYRRALAAWDDDYLDTVGAFAPQSPDGEKWRARALPIGTALTKRSLAANVARLQRALTTPDGTVLEQGRVLYAQGRWADAELALGRFMERQPASAELQDARYLRHRAQLNRAIEMLEGATRNAAEARRVLEGMAADPWDPAVGLARIAAVGTRIASTPDEAREALTAALDEYIRNQPAPPGATTLDGLAEDVAEIRRLVFRPAGGDPYTRWGQWEQFPPSSPRPYLVVSPQVMVVLADGTEQMVAAFRAEGDVRNVLFIEPSDLDLLRRSIPVFPPWDEYLEIRGWNARTAPVFERINFLDDVRTKAAVKVALPAEGVTVVLEKAGGAWKVVRLTDYWIA